MLSGPDLELAWCAMRFGELTELRRGDIDLRHTGAVLAARTGATLAELMGRLGHATPGAAMRYQHAAAGRDAETLVGSRSSRLATPTVGVQTQPTQVESLPAKEHDRAPA